MAKDLKLKCPNCDGDNDCQTCNGWGELNAYAFLPEIIDRETLKNQFEESAKALLLLAHALSNDPTEPQQPNLFRADKINMMVGDMVKMRDCMLDTYDIPWQEYSTKFKETVQKVLLERSKNDG